MKTIDELLEDFATAPVPASATVSGTRVALIILGISIALPGFVSGAQIGSALGLQQAGIAFFAGGAILAAVAICTALVGAEARLSTYMLVQFAFGTGGARLVNCIFAMTMAGWFGVNSALFGDAMVATMGDLYDWSGGWAVYVGIGSLLMVLTTLFGFKALDRLSLLAVPLLVVFLVVVTGMAIAHAPAATLLGDHEPAMRLGVAISAVAGGSMVGAASIPDLTRYISSRAGAIGSMVVAYGLGAPLILLAAAVPSLATGEDELMSIFVGLGLGLPALFVLVFATWTSNAANLYGSGLSLAATFPSTSPWKLTLLGGALGATIALSGVITVFIPFLVALGVLMPPVAAIYVVDFYIVARRRYDPAVLRAAPAVRWSAIGAWILGCAVGWLSLAELLVLTSVPACDSLLGAGLAYLWLARFEASRSPDAGAVQC